MPPVVTRKPARARARAAPPAPAIVKPPTGELGVTGLSQSMGVIDEEVLAELKGDRAIRTYKEMLTDSVIAGGLNAIDLFIRRVEWSAEPASQDPADVANAEYLWSCVEDMSSSWTSTVSEVTWTMLSMGWAAHEIVYKQRLGRRATPGESSAYNDGLWGWRKLPIRACETREKWEFGNDGGVEAMIQRDPNTHRQITIPIDRLLLFRPREAKGSPEGEPVTRPCFLPWYYKSNVRRFQGIGAERQLAGTPRAKVPAAVIVEGGAAYAGWQRTMALLKENRHKSLIVPSDLWADTSEPQYDVDLIQSEGKRNFDTVQLIDSYNQEIGRALLTGFMGMGERTSSGSWAAAEVFSSVLGTAIGAWLGSIVSVFNRHAVPRLFSFNPSLRVGDAGYPKLVTGDLDFVNFGEFAKAWATLSAGGFEFTAEDDAWFRRRVRLPVKTEDATPLASEPEDEEE